jgi:hypothetical protein
MACFFPPSSNAPASFIYHLHNPAASSSFLAMENKKLLIILGVMFVVWLVMALLGLAWRPW